MKKINGLQNFSFIDFSKTAGELEDQRTELYYNKKNSKIRMFDDSHIIKLAGNNLEFVKNLEALNIEQVNSPIDFLQDKHEENKYYIISKYLENYLELDYYSKQLLPLEEILNYFIQIMQILQNCHNKDFFVGDLHFSNILISPDKKAFLFDFDKSIFLKDKIISADKNESLYTLYDNFFVQNILKNTYGIRKEDLSFYNSNIDLLIPYFIEMDKECILREIIGLLCYKFQIHKDKYEITKNDFKKMPLPRSLEKKLIDCLINNNPLYSDDYLIDELTDFKDSRLVRKKLNR